MPTEIVIKNIKHDIGGTIVFMVFAKDGFPKDHSKVIYRHEIKPTAEEELFQAELPEGEIAVKVHHDENSDGKVSKNWTRIIPSEGLAFSNGVRIWLGPPSFKAAKLLNDGIARLEFSMNYPWRHGKRSKPALQQGSA